MAGISEAAGAGAQGASVAGVVAVGEEVAGISETAGAGAAGAAAAVAIG